MPHCRPHHWSTLLFAFSLTSLSAQVSGNINQQQTTRYPDQSINITPPGTNDLVVTIKGLANIQADTYVAIFSITQTGKTAQEVNELLEQRIAQATARLSTLKGLTTHTDIISFVPLYEYAIEKKTFSKKTYNEVPIGFELKKNLHIQYNQPQQLNSIVTALADSEIYDLVRVDYIVTDIGTVRQDLAERSKAILQRKLQHYEALLGEPLNSTERRIADGYKVLYPTEMYRSYEAYNSSALVLSKPANVNQANKSTTLYYQPVLDKEFDYVLHPTVLEPVVQVLYEVKLVIIRPPRPSPTPAKPTHEYLLITPAGDIKPIRINN